VAEITATDAGRNLSDLLDAVEHRGERYVIVRRGRAVARLEPVDRTTGADVKALLRAARPDSAWRSDLDEVRGLLQVEDRS